jgi:hypothetical protein
VRVRSGFVGDVVALYTWRRFWCFYSFQHSDFSGLRTIGGWRWRRGFWLPPVAYTILYYSEYNLYKLSSGAVRALSLCCYMYYETLLRYRVKTW